MIDAMQEPQLLRPAEVQRILKVSKTWLYDAAKQRRIPERPIGWP